MIRNVAGLIATWFGMALVLVGALIVAGGLLLAISPTTFLSVAGYLPEPVQERLAMDMLAVTTMGDMRFTIVCAMALGGFLVWLGIRTVKGRRMA